MNSLASARIKRYEKVNSEKIQAFFTELRTENGSNKRIHLILDGAGYHRAKVVKDKADELNITLHFLPPNSPNLNPIERLCKVIDEHVRNNKYFAMAKEFRDKIDEFFSQKLPKIRDILASRIKDNFQVLNSAS
ncbi:MAG: transposase [Cognaticolwellia sp.]